MEPLNVDTLKSGHLLYTGHFVWSQCNTNMYCQGLIEREGMQLIQQQNKKCYYFSNTKLREILEFSVYFPMPQ